MKNKMICLFGWSNTEIGPNLKGMDVVFNIVNHICDSFIEYRDNNMVNHICDSFKEYRDQKVKLFV